MKRNVISEIASECQRFHNAIASNNANTSFNKDDAKKRILYYEQHILPHGSGIDSGCSVDIMKSGIDKVTIDVPHHDMDENGMYCGWSYYRVVVTMNFAGLNVKVTGGKKADREYIRELMQNALEYVPTSEELNAAHKAVYFAG